MTSRQHMKIFFNRKLRRNPWGGGIHFANGLADFLVERGHKVTNFYDPDVDVILMFDPRDDEGFGSIEHLLQYKTWLINKGKAVKVVHRINDTDIARGTNFLIELNIKSNQIIADETVFISDWLKQHYESKGFNRNSHVITNGCNQNWFYPAKEKSYDGPIKVVTHHWSDNYNKGFDAYIELDKQLSNRSDIQFTYVGRYYKNYKPINTKIVEPMYGKKLGDELRNHHIYLTSAKWEACGMHHIEASSCGLPVAYHEDGGGVNEICRTHGVMFKDVSKICDVLKDVFIRREELINKIPYEKLSDVNTNERFLKIFEK